MTERVDIANIALSLLGEPEVTSLDDDLKQARQVKINYSAARDATLEAHEWSFALTRWRPSPSATPPDFGPAYAFPVPSDVLRVLSVHDDPFFSVTEAKEQVQWVLEENKILCDEQVIYCRGIKRVTEEGRFSPLFVHALAAKIAFFIALNLTASAEIQSTMAAVYAGFIKEARSRDGVQGRNKRIRHRRLAQVR